MTDITAIILTKNEEKNIVNCIESLRGFAQRIVVVDSYSDDKTVELAKELNVEVHYNKFINYATQFNWALDNLNISTKWCLRIDADERFTRNLVLEVDNIIQSANDTDLNGIVLDADLVFMNKKLRYGSSRKRKLMIFRTGVGRIEDRNMDEHTILANGYTVSAKNRYIHYDYKSIDVFVKKLNWYATREMIDYFNETNASIKVELNDKKIKNTRKKKYGIYYRFPSFIRSKLLFIYFQYFKLGFLDGKEGFIYNYLYTRYYRLLVDIKIYEHKKFKNTIEDTGDLK